jgi:MYXO-CTERM domain-containing protein
MKNTVIASIGVALIAAAANAAVIVNQPNDTGNGYTSQDFTDFPAYSGSCFDDFTLSGQTQLGVLTVYGTEGGTSGANIAVVARIFASPDLTSPALGTVVGTQVGADLVFDMSSVTLNGGTYWLSAQVIRPFGGGGQWFWNTSSTTNGAHSMYHNPGGGFGVGTAPVSTAVFNNPQWDMAFTLEGTEVPGPGALALMGAAGLLRRRRR